VDYVITEYGIAHLRGRTVSERVRTLIAIAHPDFRKDLEKEARKMLLF
jgi:acyl-CoA hydrolase